MFLRNSTSTIPLFLLVLLVSFPQLSETIYSPALPTIATEMEATPFLVELSLSIYFLGFAFGTAVWGYLSDLWGRRPSMLLGLALYCFSCLLLASASTISSILFYRAIQAFGASVGSVITQTIIRDTQKDNEKHRTFSIISMAIAFAPCIGPFLGGFICEWQSWRATFVFLGLFVIVLFYICLRELVETRPLQSFAKTRPSFVSTAQMMLRDVQLLGHVLFISGCNGILFGFFAEGPFLTMNILGMTSYNFSFFGMLISAGILFAGLLSYHLQKRKTPMQIIRYGLNIIRLGSGFLLACAVMGILTMGNFWGSASLSLGLALTFFGVGLIIPNSLSVALQSYKKVVGTAGAVFGLLYYIGIASMVALVGWMHNGSTLTLPLYLVIQAAVLTVGYSFASPSKALLAERVQAA